MLGGACDRPESDFQICWNESEDVLAILVAGEVLGVFKIEEKFGSNPTFTKVLPSQINADLRCAFQPR